MKQKTVLRYAGGKSRAIKKITPFVEPYDTIISPFIGGGSLEVHWASMGKKVEGSDVFDLLVNFWDMLLNNNEELVSELKKITPNVEEYKEIKEKLIQTPQVQQMLKEWKTDFYLRVPSAIDGPTLAAYYYFNHNCSYGPGFLGWASKIYMNQKKWDKTIDKIKNFSCPSLSVTHRGFEEAIQSNPDKFLYLDPPYYLEKDADNKMLGGIYPMKNIPVHHNSFDHEKLRDLLHNHDGDFVLSYNNCETIREWYSDYEFFYPEWHYSMDVGETRIGENRLNRIDEEQNNEAVQLQEAIDRLQTQIETITEILEEYGIEKTPNGELKSLEKVLAKLKTEKHDILKKESHEILIVKRKNNE